MHTSTFRPPCNVDHASAAMLMQALESRPPGELSFEEEGRKTFSEKGSPAEAIKKLAAEALLQYQRGILTQTEEICEKLLALDERHPDALHLRGLVAFRHGRYAAALRSIRTAAALDPTNLCYQSNLGGALQACGKLEEAVFRYKQALLINSTAEVHYNLANVLRDQEKHDAAIAEYKLAINLKPQLLEAQNNLGNVLRSRGRLDEARVYCDRALQLQPDCAEAHSNSGNILRDQGALVAALESYRHAIELEPGLVQAHYNLANMLQEQEQFEAARSAYERALALDPLLFEAHYNMGCLAYATGNAQDAILHYRKAIHIKPHFGKARLGEALAQLLHEDYSSGWSNYEWRWQSADHDTLWRRYQQPLWAGENLEAGSLLVWGEQGIGDEVMFAGLLPEVLDRTPHCILDCDQRLQPLFARSFPAIEVVSGYLPDHSAASAPAETQKIVAHIPSGSLAEIFRSGSADFVRVKSPYLFADEKARSQLRADYDDGRRLVGLAWQTSNVRSGKRRSIALSELKALFQVNETRWISLQYGDHDALQAQADAAGAPVFIDPAIDQLADLDSFAAQISALDLVITIDNSTAHLAGALGVPVWLMLPFAPDWRWQRERANSPWYPRMRLFRQATAGDWQPVIEQVRHELELQMNSLLEHAAPNPGGEYAHSPRSC